MRQITFNRKVYSSLDARKRGKSIAIYIVFQDYSYFSLAIMNMNNKAYMSFRTGI